MLQTNKQIHKAIVWKHPYEIRVLLEEHLVKIFTKYYEVVKLKIPKPRDSRVPRLVNPPPTIPNIYKVVYLNGNQN